MRVFYLATWCPSGGHSPFMAVSRPLAQYKTQGTALALQMGRFSPDKASVLLAHHYYSWSVRSGDIFGPLARGMTIVTDFHQQWSYHGTCNHPSLVTIDRAPTTWVSALCFHKPARLGVYHRVRVPYTLFSCGRTTHSQSRPRVTRSDFSLFRPSPGLPVCSSATDESRSSA